MCRDIVNDWITEDYEVLAEDVEGFLYLHCEVFSEKLSVFKELKRLSEEVVEWAYSEGYDGAHALTPNDRFANFIPGAMFLQNFEYEGKEYGLYKWG